jgi:hypothetical protein
LFDRRGEGVYERVCRYCEGLQNFENANARRVAMMDVEA